jgi:N-hydroxyarylamine O-acetyltransferase
MDAAASTFDQDAWLRRIGYQGSRVPTLDALRGLVDAHSSAISYESIDVLLDRPPQLDLASLQRKMILQRRGGYCFEQNFLFRAGLRSLGFDVTSLQARVVRGLAIDAQRPMLHMVLQVKLPEGPYLADVGFGNVAPTAPLRLVPDLEQETPHEVMRFIRMGEELTLQSRLGDDWAHIYRVVFLPRIDSEYEMCNWSTATHPKSIHRSTLIVARPGPGKTRVTLFNALLTVRYANGETETRMLARPDEYRDILRDTFGLELSDAELMLALETVAQNGAKGAPHPFFA